MRRVWNIFIIFSFVFGCGESSNESAPASSEETESSETGNSGTVEVVTSDNGEEPATIQTASGEVSLPKDTEAPAKNAIIGTLYVGVPDDELTALTSASNRIANAQVKLFALDGNGKPSGNPIKTTTSDAEGKYQFTFDNDVDLNNLNYVVLTQIPNSGEVRNTFVHDLETDVSVSSTVGTLAFQVAMMLSAATLTELDRDDVKQLIATITPLLTDDSASLATIYDAIVTNSDFRSLFNQRFDTDVSGVDLRKLPPQVLGVTIKVNNIVTTDTSVKTGDSVEIDALIIDPKGLPVEVGFYQMRSCSGVGFIQDFSSSSKVTYTFVEADITNCTSIIIAAKNNDGIDFDSNLLGDLQYGISFSVSDHREPPTVDSVVVKKDGVTVNANDFKVGEELTLEVNATDPNGLPLEYRFYLMRSCGGAGDLQSWSSSSTLTYTFATEDITNCTSIIVYVKNNDDIEKEGTGWGDLQYGVSFNVTDHREPPVVNSITFKKNGSSYSGNDFQVGDTVTITVNASDPNSLPLEYRFYQMRNCGGVGDVQSWSSSNETSYTFVEADITSCTSIIVYVRNNDGLELEGTGWGDLQQGNSFDVNF